MSTKAEVICISDDEADDVPRTPPPSDGVKEEAASGPRRRAAPSFDESLLLSSPETKKSPSRGRATPPRPKRGRASVKPKKSPATNAEVRAFLVGFTTPPRKRRSGAREDVLKPITPSTSVQSSMNASLVFDMVTALSTNDPGVAIAALRSIVVLGKEYPSNLLFDELVDRILTVEAIAYADAVSIYASLVFVYDKAASCSCDLEFPHQWEPLANALQDASVLPKNDERWRRTLLVVQFFVYCFKKDFDVCRQRYESEEGAEWIYRTRLFALLHNGDAGTSLSGRTTKRAFANRLKIQNNLILQAIGCGLTLWQRVHDDHGSNSYFADDSDTIDTTLEAEDACMAVVRLIEMLFLCTDQAQNILQRLQAGLLDLSRETRVIFSQTLLLPDLKARLATTVMGLTNKSRSKEHEWYECNALGRLMLSINSDASAFASNDVAATEGYSWSHYDSFMSSAPRNDFARLLQEMVGLQKEQ